MAGQRCIITMLSWQNGGEMRGNGQQTAVLSSAAAQSQAADCQQHSGVCVCDVFESRDKGQT